jgi:hypothetical protein
VRGEGDKERVKKAEYTRKSIVIHVVMYENGKMRHVGTIPGMQKERG